MRQGSGSGEGKLNSAWASIRYRMPEIKRMPNGSTLCTYKLSGGCGMVEWKGVGTGPTLLILIRDLDSLGIWDHRIGQEACKVRLYDTVPGSQ
jgi:hypothetical protein